MKEYERLKGSGAVVHELGYLQRTQYDLTPDLDKKIYQTRMRANALFSPDSPVSQLLPLFARKTIAACTAVT
jgi:hypothetical protein